MKIRNLILFLVIVSELLIAQETLTLSDAINLGLENN